MRKNLQDIHTLKGFWLFLLDSVLSDLTSSTGMQEWGITDDTSLSL